MAGSDPLLKQLELARRDLLELSTQNRLLHTERDQARGLSLEVKDELSEEVYRILVTENRPMRFEQGVEVEATLEAEEPAAVEEESDEPAEEEATEEEKPKPGRKKAASKTAATPKPPAAKKRVTRKKAAPAKPAATTPSRADDPNRYIDNILHTELDGEELDRRLMGLNTDATATFQDLGINILYLCLGFLKWFDPTKPDVPRYAPLIMIPVQLQRTSAGKRFNLVYSGDDIVTNLTLRIRLKMEGGISLPEVPDGEDLSPSAYFSEVERAITAQKGWEVLGNDMVLWFYSFSKLLMYRDLDPTTWPTEYRLEDRPLIRGLLQDGFSAVAPLVTENQSIDSVLDPVQTVHIIDSDSSQSLVVEEVTRGRSLIIQGPPGTGKSQTITNLIASAVKSGKTILFVAEKMAALEVVKRRLDNIGLGDMCLELHSEKASKRVVLQEMDRTLRQGKPIRQTELPEVIQALKSTRDQLNQHATLLHSPQASSGMTPYQVVTDMLELRMTLGTIPDFQMGGVEKWSAEQSKQYADQVKDYTASINALNSPPDKHPWRGSNLDKVLPMDLERMVARVPEVSAKLEPMWTTARTLAQRLGDDPPTTLGQIGRQLRTLRAILNAPPLDPQAHNNPVWNDQRNSLKDLGEHCRAILRAREKLATVITDTAWETDVAQARIDYARRGKSWFRMLFPSYRRARRLLRKLLVGKQPRKYAERQEILDLLHGYQKGIKELTDANEIGSRTFGRFWLGKKSDWKQIEAIERWDADTAAADTSPRFRGMLGLIEKPEALAQFADKLEAEFTAFLTDLSGLCTSFQFDLPSAFLNHEPAPRANSTACDAALQKLRSAGNESLIDLRDRLKSWNGEPERLQHWRNYVNQRARVMAIGDGTFLDKAEKARIAPENLSTALTFAHREAIFRQMLRDQPALASFNGDRHQRLIDEFATVDQKRMLLARNEVAEYAYASISKRRGPGMKEAIDLLRQEMQKKRRHLPLRQLLNKAGKAIQAVKPVFMMSPLSVAQFLEPGALDFDLMLIDEASQVRPVEALGAAARCRQMIVVGDEKQMPPTQFFGVTVGDIQLDDGETVNMAAGDVESILGLAMARNVPQRMLRWHYRSKHHTLIAVSNREFYDNQLYVVPSPELTGELGIKYHPIKDGKFIDRVNPIEARIVAEAVMAHARKHPDWTLGIGTFSVTQRDLILKEVEKARQANPDLESFFDPNAPDPFFVKNLENIQGDERDVIFVSVGYGPDEKGKVSLNFGPVSSVGGERRLNVLMTRAKRRCDIFSSMKPEDIDLTRATGKGPAVLRAFLQYAQQGEAGSRPTASTESGDRFTELIRKQLIDKGYDVRTRVGVAGIFIDLAVVDPDDKSRFLIGIECDGLSYATGRTCRDRERLRQQVLQAQGWEIHRIWCLDWFQRPAEQLQKLINAIEVVRRRKGKPVPTGVPPLPNVSTIEREPTGTDPLTASVSEVEPEIPGISPGPAHESVGAKVRDAITGVAADILSKTFKDLLEGKPEEKPTEKPKGRKK